MRRSRFIASIGPAADSETAHAFVDRIRVDYPDANHHCWAFTAGPPGDTAEVGLSDGGEPHGTAGRPILDTLLHSGVGEIVAVVTRYFGGVKLGRGGLGRAYAASVAAALDTLPTTARVSLVTVHVTVPFSASDPLFRELDALDARERRERYGSEVQVTALVPEDRIGRLQSEVARVTSGRGKVVVSLDDPNPRTEVS